MMKLKLINVYIVFLNNILYYTKQKGLPQLPGHPIRP